MSELETARLRLRPLRHSDLDALERIYLDPEVARYLITRPQTREDMSRTLDQMLEQAKLFGLWAIELKETGELIGRAGFYGYTLDGSLEPELAYLLRRDCWGKGLATEAALAALARLRTTHGPRRVVAIVVPEHAVSRHILEKLGMRQVESAEIRGVHALVYAREER